MLRVTPPAWTARLRSLGCPQIEYSSMYRTQAKVFPTVILVDGGKAKKVSQNLDDGPVGALLDLVIAASTAASQEGQAE